MVPYDSFESQHEAKEQEEARSGRDGGKIERKLSDVNTRAVSRGQSELVGELKMEGTVMWHCVFTYIYSLLIDKDLCESQNSSNFHVLF